MNSQTCSICRDGHRTEKCPELYAPLGDGFYRGGGGGGSHSHDEDEKLSLFVVTNCEQKKAAVNVGFEPTTLELTAPRYYQLS